MKLGLLTAIREDTDLPRESMIKRVMTNLAPMYLAGYLEKMGSGVEVLIKDNLDDLIEAKPEILGISSVTENIEFARSLASQAKAIWDSITILGGAHITSLPKVLPKEFDLAVIGEGEETVFDLVRHIQKHGSLNEDHLRQIPGLSYHIEGGVHQTPFRKGLNSLDDIPHPARHKYIKKTGITYMMTSRGCPYTCNFCSIPNISEGYRTHSPEYVVEEISSIKKQFSHVQHIGIFDDLYIVNRKRVEAIADLVSAEGINQDLSFSCWVRANLIDEKMVHTLNKMNMLYVAFGAESGSSRVLSKIKPGCTLEQNQQAIDLLHDHGIRVTLSLILGHPEETEEDLWATYHFIEKNLDKILEVEFNVAIPWPGTDLWEGAKKRGLVHEEMDFGVLKECAHFLNYSTDLYPYLNENISRERFDEILDDFKALDLAFAKKKTHSALIERVNPEGGIAQLF